MIEPRILVVDANRRYENDRPTTSSFNGHLQNSLQEEHMPNVYEVRRYKTVDSVWATILSLAIEAILFAVVLQLRWYCQEKRCGVQAASIAVYLNCAVWLFTLIIHRYIRRQRDQLRRYGYAEFYHNTRTTSTVPSVVFSCGGVVLLIYLTALNDLNCSDLWNVCKTGIDAFGWIQIVISLEVLVAFPFLFVFLVHSLRFNMCRQTPDIFRESPLDQDNVSVRRDVGFRSQTIEEELLEKQSDAIAYLKLRCEDLTRTIFALTSVQSASNSTDDLRASLNTNDAQLLLA